MAEAKAQDPAAALLEARIAELDAEISDLEAQLRARVEEREARAAALGALRGLDKTYQSVTLDDTMMAFERVKHSKSRKSASPNNAALRKACTDERISIRDLAKEISRRKGWERITVGHLSRMADPNGDLLIESELADWIAARVNFPASRWPRVKRAK